ncbi:Glutamate receptor 3.4 [Camellia lanceoleosa]|uniref:Glutamate receptor 3.4 n=1 Tax=Camellia lanceoleosa TaxID=1840588 RepID=A0ACC0HJ63_9ERIC|nr:Glutamate receptor 3.4 [Camellia lanceoleosa]
MAKPAIEAAVDDVNSDLTVLAEMKLNLFLHDTNCSVFLGIVEALQLMENDVVAVIGPQSSGIVHVISRVVNELHVPLMSFAATDPMLSALQFPYFLRTTHNDYFQILRLDNFFCSKVASDVDRRYIWIATDWLPSVLDLSESIDPNTMNLLQGIIALHHHTPDFDLKKSFTSRWKNFTYRETSSINGSTLHLTRLRTFQEGQKLLQILPGMNFTGLTGQIQFDSEKNLILPAFDILKISGNGS